LTAATADKWNWNGTAALHSTKSGMGGLMIIRVMFGSVTLAFAGILAVVLSAHLGSRYKEQTASLGFNGVYERVLASWAGFADDPRGYRAFAQAAQRTPPFVQQASALEE
jgi:hypothetical protein